MLKCITVREENIHKMMKYWENGKEKEKHWETGIGQKRKKWRDGDEAVT
jgi:hypothetical protein